MIQTMANAPVFSRRVTSSRPEGGT
ncbi:MAG: hypothetical protein QOD05_2414, partial [Microbacteriaceae bacterium]|nr:hypothetical protein [Microbacteriaceae bacterium]